MAKSKKEKVNEARKKAEALKAKKKEVRGSKAVNASSEPGKGKGKSIIGQSKKAKK